MSEITIKIKGRIICFRKASISDVEELAKIRMIFLSEATEMRPHEQSMIEMANREYLKSALADNSLIVWLAVSGDEIIATSGLTFSIIPPYIGCPNGKAAYIMNMFTFPDYRKHGIGTELLRKNIEETKSRDCKKIGLISTEMGHPLYVKFGFKDVTDEMYLYIN